MSAAITLAAPLPGLGALTDFTLDEIPGASGLFALQSLDSPERRMFVLDASVYVPDYHPYLSDADCDLISLESPEDAMVLLVSNTSGGGPAVNLLAPIVVNTVTAVGAQVILEGQDYPIRHSLTPVSAG